MVLEAVAAVSIVLFTFRRDPQRPHEAGSREGRGLPMPDLRQVLRLQEEP